MIRLKIGTKISFERTPLLLAPMEDVTDGSFRALCKSFGADMVYTEFVSSDALIRDAAKSLKKLEISDEERPIGIQIYGNVVDAMVESTEIAAAHCPDLIDINFGCPVRKIAGRGAGSGMMRNVELMVKITDGVVRKASEYGIPVTVKTRLGWDTESLNIEEIALRLQDVGIDGLTIHGRTREQMYKGVADWTLIGRVKNNPNVRIPIIGNGDVTTGERAREVIDRYGVDGVMIGRGTYGRPWIFRDVKHFLEYGERLAEPTVGERVDIARRHLALSVACKGERVGVLELRRHLSCYFKGFPEFKEIRICLVTEPTAEGLLAIFDKILDRYSDFDATVLIPSTVYN